MRRSVRTKGAAISSPSNRTELSRVYSEETWRVYDLLEQSLAPRGPDALYDVAAPYLTEGSRLLDAGCRDAAHLIQLVQRTGATGVGVDAVDIHIDRAKAAVEAADVAERVDVFVGDMQDLPFPDGHFDFVWCRDVLGQVADLDAALRESARVLNPTGHMLVYTTFATDGLSAEETELLSRHLANVPANLSERNVEGAFAKAGLTIEHKSVIGTEWREHLEEQTGTTAHALLQLSRLRRQRDVVVERFGQDIYDSVEANLHWGVFQFLGKLAPTVYILRRDN